MMHDDPTHGSDAAMPVPVAQPRRAGLRDRLPGVSRDKRVKEMIRVDHAGEYGAVRIYEGQLAVFRGRRQTQETANLIEHMADQEQHHLETFDQLLNDRQVRPTALAPVWHAAGFALGAATALMGEKAAMACTAAVEEAIDDHYAEQELALETYKDDELAEVVSDFRADEAEHRSTALARGAEETPGYPVLSAAIKGACRLAIKLSEKV